TYYLISAFSSRLLIATCPSFSTPGVQVPGGWTEKPTTANQMLSDAGTTLAAVGSAAYNALPESVKGAFSSQSAFSSSLIVALSKL
ncbi:hypothetical protein DL93DRAFT_2084306, partial [Clavulina sp. PMI_390]